MQSALEILDTNQHFAHFVHGMLMPLTIPLGATASFLQNKQNFLTTLSTHATNELNYAATHPAAEIAGFTVGSVIALAALRLGAKLNMYGARYVAAGYRNPYVLEGTFCSILGVAYPLGTIAGVTGIAVEHSGR